MTASAAPVTDLGAFRQLVQSQDPADIDEYHCFQALLYAEEPRYLITEAGIAAIDGDEEKS